MDVCPDGRLETPGGGLTAVAPGAHRTLRPSGPLDTHSDRTLNNARGGSRGIARDQAEATIECRGIRLDPAGDEGGAEEAGQGQDVLQVALDLGGRAILPRGQVAGQPGAIPAGEPGQGLEIDADERLESREGGGLPVAEAGARLGVGRALEIAGHRGGRGAQDQPAAGPVDRIGERDRRAEGRTDAPAASTVAIPARPRPRFSSIASRASSVRRAFSSASETRERRTAPARIGIRAAGVAGEVHDDHQGEQPTAAGRSGRGLGLLGGRLRGRIEIRDHAGPERRAGSGADVLPQQQPRQEDLEVA